ncbi:MAG: sigma-70 family RNA polymerase sigma factor [Bacteroidaceae bacterium]|nr:sigma-70 family RNA polymerase sigma factor [Bacteroidaceae bacterium]
MQEKTLQRDILPHRDKLYRLALSITLHTAEAEDVVQDTMMQAWNHRNEWDEIANMGGWLSQICRRLALDRRQRMDRMSSLPDPTQQADRHTAFTGSDITFEQRERLTTICDMMESLPPPQNDVIRLRDIEGMTYKDIANELSLTEEQVKVYLFRARQRIKTAYSKIENYGL